MGCIEIGDVSTRTVTYFARKSEVLQSCKQNLYVLTSFTALCTFNFFKAIQSKSIFHSKTLQLRTILTPIQIVKKDCWLNMCSLHQTVGMKEHIKGAITDSPEAIIRNEATPAAEYLFETSDDDERLSPELADKFHRIVAKLLYVTKRARVDILLAIAFLCTRVADPDVQDWKKMKRVLQYLRGTLDDVMRLGADSLFEMKTWVDASYAVHPDKEEPHRRMYILRNWCAPCHEHKAKVEH